MKQIITKLVDDLDGSEASETVQFAMDGVTFEIDLNDVHAKQLREAFAPYVDAGRKANTARRSPAREQGTVAQRRQFNQAVREWATASGWVISGRGRIPANVIEAYRVAA